MHNSTDGCGCLVMAHCDRIVEGCKLAAVKLPLVKNTFHSLNTARRGY